jgi:hypothetical protein
VLVAVAAIAQVLKAFGRVKNRRRDGSRGDAAI